MLSFFPSKTLAIYTGKMFVIRTIAVLAMLVVILQSLDLLSQSGNIMAFPGNGQSQLWQYVSMRTPQLIATFLPFSVLLGTLITFVTLNQNSEVIMMKAGGLSAHQILAPLILASLLVAMISFAFNETVVAPSTNRLSQWQKVDYGPIPKESDVRTNVWVRDGNDLINAKIVTGRGDNVRLRDITIYDRSENGLRDILHGEEGRFTGQGWEITGVRQFNVAAGNQSAADKIIIGKELLPDQFTLSTVNADGLNFFELKSAIAELQKREGPPAALRQISITRFQDHYPRYLCLCWAQSLLLDWRVRGSCSCGPSLV